jgi:nucleotide-binding universal stress UspA family protein
MKKIIFGLAIVLVVSISFLMACSGGKSAADLAIKTAEQAVNATKAEAAKVVPDQVKSLEDTLASAKEKFVKGEYKAALEEATPLAGKAKDVLAAAKAKKEELTKKWTELSQGVPQMVADLQSRVDVLSKAKKLPASITKEKFEEAKAGLASITDEWTKAQDSFKTGSFVDAVSMATSVKDKAVKAMEALGMSVPAPAPVPVPAAAPAPAK